MIDFRIRNILVAEKQLYYPFTLYKNLKFLSGSLEINYYKKWIKLMYLKFNEVIKICSFFNFNYGTTSLNDAYLDYQEYELYETIDCLENATNLENCQFHKTKYI